MKTKFTLSLILFVCLVVGTFAKKPNIVFILADDCTKYDIGCYGGPEGITPTIDSLAATGVKFNRCYQAAPTCSPTRHSIYSGLYPVRSGAYTNHTHAYSTIQSAPDFLKPLGYRVAITGKRHIGPASVFEFEYLEGNAGYIGDKADAFLADVAQNNENFVLFACSQEPHSPWTKGDQSMFHKDSITLPPTYADTDLTRTEFRNYLAEINYLDGQVKYALEILKKHGLEDNTIIMFASEQGNGFPFAKWTCYNAGLGSALVVNWPDSIATGLETEALVEYTDILPTIIDLAGGEPVENLDGSSFLPILKQEKTTHKKYTYGIATTRGITSGSEYYPIRSVADSTYRLIWNLSPNMQFSNTTVNKDYFAEWVNSTKEEDRDKAQRYKVRPEYELYNDVEDPYNMHNLINDAQYADKVAELKAELLNWMEYCGDVGLKTELRAEERMNREATSQEITVIMDTMPSLAEGNLDITTEGYYSFYTSTSYDVYVDGIKIIGEIQNPAQPQRTGVIGLKSGKHNIEVKNSVGDAALRWSFPPTKFQKKSLDLGLGNPIPGNLLFHFPFNGNLNDSSGYSYTLANTGGYTFTEGKFGAAVELDGSQFFNLQNSIINTGEKPFTVCAWVYNTQTAAQRNGDPDTDILMHQLGGRVVLQLQTNSNGTGNLGTWIGGAAYSEGNNEFVAGQWQHIAITFDPVTRVHTYYVNGLQTGTTTSTNAFENENEGFRIGAHKNGSNQWHGKIDELYMFSEVLSAPEIAELMDGPTSVNLVMKREEFVVYPNPTSNVLQIISEKVPEKVSLYRVDGTQILTAVNTQQVNTSEIPEGYYMLNVAFGNGDTQTSKVLIQK